MPNCRDAIASKKCVNGVFLSFYQHLTFLETSGDLNETKGSLQLILRIHKRRISQANMITVIVFIKICLLCKITQKLRPVMPPKRFGNVCLDRIASGCALLEASSLDGEMHASH